jgi:ketosteroid isomerase-like protein
LRTKIILIALTLLIFPAVTPRASAPSQSAATELTAMLNQFLQIAATNDAAGFDRFFSDDVIYTHSAGTVTNKAEIMKGVSSARSPRPDTTTKYSAEDVTIHEYPDVAIVAFRLVSEVERTGAAPTITNYRNTGTFLRRNGKWQVIAWQSTKIPDAPK